MGAREVRIVEIIQTLVLTLKRCVRLPAKNK